MSAIAQNIHSLLEKIQAHKAKKNLSQEVKLIAISKTFPAERIKEAFEAGQRIFGENKVQEAETKKIELSDYPIEWHLVGHLQTNKVKKAVEIFDYIHSVDSIRLAQKINETCQTKNKKISILLQINTSKEESKSGLPDDETIIQETIAQILTMPYLDLRGFMTIGPLTEDEKKIRDSFIRLRKIKEKMQTIFPQIKLHELSMGMSQDYLLAIEEGATMIRIGSAIFGERKY